MLTWPSTLPAPLWTPYQLQPVGVTERTPTDDGKFRARPRAKKTPYLVNLSVALSEEQGVLARMFYEAALHMGSDAFLMRLRSGSRLYAQQVQFTDEPVYDPLPPSYERMSMRVMIHNDLGRVLWCDVAPSNRGVAIELGSLTGFTVSKLYLFCRTAFNGGSDSLDIGWTGTADALVDGIATPASGAMTTIAAGNGSAGASLAVHQAAAKTITVTYNAAGAASAGDACVVIPYTEP